MHLGAVFQNFKKIISKFSKKIFQKFHFLNGDKVSKMMENRVFSQEELLKMKKIMDTVKELAEESYRIGKNRFL